MSLFLTFEGLGHGGFLGPSQHGHPVSIRERGGVRPSCSHMGMENVAHTQGLCPRRKEAGSSLALKGCRTYFGKGLHTTLRVTSDPHLNIQLLQDLISAFTLSPIQLHHVSFKARTSKEIRVKKSAKEAHTRTQELLKYFWKAGQVKADLFFRSRKNMKWENKATPSSLPPFVDLRRWHPCMGPVVS